MSSSLSMDGSHRSNPSNHLASRDAKSRMSRYEFMISECHVFAQEVSVIGVRPAMDPKRGWTRRIIWWSLIVVGVGLAVYQIQERLRWYFSYSASTDFMVTPATEIRFPQTTICNENMMQRNIADLLSKFCNYLCCFVKFCSDSTVV